MKAGDAKKNFKVVKNSRGHTRRIITYINFYVTLLQKKKISLSFKDLMDISVLADYHEMKMIVEEFYNQFKVEIKVLVDKPTLRGVSTGDGASATLNLSQKTFFLHN